MKAYNEVDSNLGIYLGNEKSAITRLGRLGEVGSWEWEGKEG
jgi:hypothetical protein